MKISEIAKQIKDLKKSFKNGKSLKLYCEEKKLSYINTSRILKNDNSRFYLSTAYHLLGLTPQRNIPDSVLYTSMKDLIEMEKYFETQFKKENPKE